MFVHLTNVSIQKHGVSHCGKRNTCMYIYTVGGSFVVLREGLSSLWREKQSGPLSLCNPCRMNTTAATVGNGLLKI